MANWTYVAVTFGLTWLVLILYLLHLRRRMLRARSAWDASALDGSSATPIPDLASKAATPDLRLPAHP